MVVIVITGHEFENGYESHDRQTYITTVASLGGQQRIALNALSVA